MSSSTRSPDDHLERDAYAVGSLQWPRTDANAADGTDGIQNLRGPHELPLIVWRSASVQELATLGLPSRDVTTTRLTAVGSTRPAKLSRYVLATGMWTVDGAKSIADAIGSSVREIERAAAGPTSRGVPFGGRLLTQPRLAAMLHRYDRRAVDAGLKFNIPTFDAHLLARRMSWMCEQEGLDVDILSELDDDVLAELWARNGLVLRVRQSDLDEARWWIDRVRFRLGLRAMSRSTR